VAVEPTPLPSAATRGNGEEPPPSNVT
jgi:hypothetical protein